MSAILILVQKVYSSKLFGMPAPGLPPSWIRYSLFTFLSRVPKFFLFSRSGAQTRSRAANNAEDTSAAEYVVMSTGGEYSSFARKRPDYNVLEKKNFSIMDWS
jgi:hypothetical protein